MEENKPLILAVEDAKKRIYAAITDEIKWGLPCFFIKGILESALGEVKLAAENEVAAARKNYEEKRKDKTDDKI